MIVFVDNSVMSDPDSVARCQTVLIDHIVVLVLHCFFGSKPPRPAAARWTGVASCASWALALALFFNLLRPLLTSLSSKDDNASSTGLVGDIDARISA